MFDRSPEQQVLPHCAAAGQGVIAFSPLAQGLLTDRYVSGVPADSRAAKGINNLARQLTDSRLRQITALNAIAQARGQSLAQMALTWLLRSDIVAGVIAGASSVEQLVDNLAAGEAPALTAEEMAAIDAALAQKGGC
jgi:L-glyceraldehyde 3-phosphate reductase